MTIRESIAFCSGMLVCAFVLLSAVAFSKGYQRQYEPLTREKAQHTRGMIVFERDGYITLPDGQRIEIPAQARMEICPDSAQAELRYSQPARLYLVAKPCNELFADGFETE